MTDFYDNDEYQVVNGVRYEIDDDGDDEYQVVNGVRYEIDDDDDDEYQVVNGVRYEIDDVDDDDDDDDDADYHHYSESKHDRYNVELDDGGNVIGFTETKRDGRIDNELDSDSTYRFENGQLIETELEDDGSIEVKIYADLDGDGFFSKVSEQYVPSDSSNQKFGITSQMALVGSDLDDVIALADDTPVVGGAGQDQFVMREIGNAVVSDYQYEENDQIVIDTGLGLTSTEQVASFVTGVEYDDLTQTLSVDFGGVATLTVVGIQADQISWDIVSVLS